MLAALSLKYIGKIELYYWHRSQTGRIAALLTAWLNVQQGNFGGYLCYLLIRPGAPALSAWLRSSRRYRNWPGSFGMSLPAVGKDLNVFEVELFGSLE